MVARHPDGIVKHTETFEAMMSQGGMDLLHKPQEALKHEKCASAGALMCY